MELTILKTNLIYFGIYFLEVKNILDRNNIIPGRIMKGYEKAKLDSELYTHFKTFIKNDLPDCFSQDIISKQSFISHKNKKIETAWTHSLLKINKTIREEISIDIAYIENGEPLFSFIYFPFKDILYLSIYKEKNYKINKFSMKYPIFMKSSFKEIFKEILINYKYNNALVMDHSNEERDFEDLIISKYAKTVSKVIKKFGSETFISIVEGESSIFVYPLPSFVWNLIPGAMFCINCGFNVKTEEEGKDLDLSFVYSPIPPYIIERK